MTDTKEKKIAQQAPPTVTAKFAIRDPIHLSTGIYPPSKIPQPMIIPMQNSLLRARSDNGKRRGLGSVGSPLDPESARVPDGP